MSGAVRFRAWRFLHPDLDVDEGPAGLSISPRVGIDMVTEEDSVRQAILLLLSTIPGERVMRPSYGSLLHRLVFAPNDDTTAGLAIHYVRQAIERWEPRVDILDVDAHPNDEMPSRLDVELTYRVRGARRIDQLAIPLDLAEETIV
jgi:phage baseplate assembly protein W